MTNDEVLQQLQHLIGSRYVATVKAYISELTGRARVVGINDISTKELDPDRIRLLGDDAGAIRSVSFG
ncbi:hypothetical protein C1886_00085 [Pseudomonas sp. FW300-N1A1]|uniref:hypothetical protein n=1 Tax=Pseudomonas sp. FW300-N1A1 TaxID=2075555 RepID=UPI000CD2A274|nr:hypothetical protein [Pseudomonas sp. FW300-N1A1]POA22666.1 hypothetical protein C1886_00085 [Pseudomonas sp. FW300-N1A1]